MGFFGKLGRGLKATGRALKPGLPILTMVVGAAGGPAVALGLKVLSGIVDAEATFPVEGSGEVKARFVQARIRRDLPALLKMAESIRGKEFVDEEEIGKAVDDLLDAQFRLASLTGLVNKDMRKVVL